MKASNMKASNVKASNRRVAGDPALATPKGTAARRPTNISLPVSLLVEARALGINVSHAAEIGIAQEVARRRQQAWTEENREALESSNAYVEAHGLPLARYRNF